MSTVAVDVVGTGFTVLDRVYATNRGPAIEELGGSCGNVLISLAMLDRHVAPVLNLGLDRVGRRLVSSFTDAGAETRFIRRRRNGRSPVLAQMLDTRSGRHVFAFRCPITNRELPRYVSIEMQDVDEARLVIGSCAVFYTDRLSVAIVEAMEAAAEGGAFVFFEPSAIGDEALFRRALAVAAILKYSNERLVGVADEYELSSRCLVVATHGSLGLEVRKGSERSWSPAHPTARVRDTSGAGDMVSVGLIDWLLGRRELLRTDLAAASIMEGVVAGQRLAAENCAHVGARGLFRDGGAARARSVLAGNA